MASWQFLYNILVIFAAELSRGAEQSAEIIPIEPDADNADAGI